MYKVTVDGVFAGYSDTAVFVRLHENGCYIPCEETEAEGVCVKLPYEFQDDEGNTVARGTRAVSPQIMGTLCTGSPGTVKTWMVSGRKSPGLSKIKAERMNWT